MNYSQRIIGESISETADARSAGNWKEASLGTSHVLHFPDGRVDLQWSPLVMGIAQNLKG